MEVHPSNTTKNLSINELPSDLNLNIRGNDLIKEYDDLRTELGFLLKVFFKYRFDIIQLNELMDNINLYRLMN